MRRTHLMTFIPITPKGGMAERSAALSACAALLWSFLGAPATAGAPVDCYTTYLGPPGGDWRVVSNWSPVMPRPGDSVCVPGDVGTDSLNLPDSISVRVFERYRDRKGASTTSPPFRGGSRGGLDAPERAIRSSAATLTGVGLGLVPLPVVPPVDAVGACCTGTQCQFTDFFDCREMGGHFRQGVVCSGATCSSGVCCRADPECTDSEDVGQSMTESLCTIEGGVYVGGAPSCSETDDPCQPHRIPAGYEIHEFLGGLENYKLPPRMNNCGEVVFNRDLHWQVTSEIFLYDNGSITQLTNNDGPDAFPDINDSGVIVHNRNSDPDEQVILVVDGKETVLSEGNVGSPSINNAGHVAWSKFVSGLCNLSAAESDIWFYDGASTTRFYADGLSNQSPEINDLDEMTWGSTTFPCGGVCCEWTAEILLAVESGIMSLPFSAPQSQAPRLDNVGRVVWDASLLGLELWESGETDIIAGFNTNSGRLNDFGDVVYQQTMDSRAWQIHLIRDGVTYDISTDLEHLTFDNGEPYLNNHGEIVWRRRSGEADTTGIRLMRRIRNGDTDFDGDVDLDDFIPMPGCFTGPVPTDGLCGCRFFDIDHDRDVDLVDYDYFRRNYTGPLEDCNANSTVDLEELLTGAAVDCDLNGRIDTCDLADSELVDCDLSGRIDVCEIADSPVLDCDLNGRIDSCDLIENPALDADLNGFIDACCTPAAAPAAELVAGEVSTKNRFLSFSAGDASNTVGIRVTFDSLPPPFDLWNGSQLWVGPPSEVSQVAAVVDPDDAPTGRATFSAARLQCTPFFADFGALGVVHVFHEGIVPEGVYRVEVLKEACRPGRAADFSEVLSMTTAVWGDTVSSLSGTPPGPPDGPPIEIDDVLGILGAFSNVNGAINKARADLEPACLDFTINVTDVLSSIAGFSGVSYAFLPTAADPCNSTCVSPLP